MRQNLYILIATISLLTPVLNAEYYQNNLKFDKILDALIESVNQQNNSSKYKEILTISNEISDIMNKIYTLQKKYNEHKIIQNLKNQKKLSFKKTMLQSIKKVQLKDFTLNCTYTGKPYITISFTHKKKEKNKYLSDYSFNFIFKDGKLILKITDLDIYKSMIFVYKQDENIFKKINLNTKVNQSALNMPVIKYENLHEIIQKEIKSSNLREQEIVVLNKTNYITEKITTLINNLKNLSMYEDNTSIYKSIYDTIHNNPSNSIEIYDYSTDASNINICFSVTGVYQISLIIRNNRISIVFWNLLNGTINALRFSQENKKFIKTSFKEMHILNTFPPKNSLIALINNVMKKNQIHQLYIDTYTSVIDDILEFIKILKNKKSTPESIQKFKRTMNEKKIAFQMNSDNNTNNISMSFVIKNVFEIKFIINNHRNIFKISLIKIPPRNTYIYDITTTNFIKENEENNLLETPKILRIM